MLVKSIVISTTFDDPCAEAGMVTSC